MNANSPQPVPVKWDDYFPLLNKAILGLLFVVAMMFATGVDLVQLGGKLLGRGDGAEAVVASESGELVAPDFNLAPAPATGPAAWRKVMVAVPIMMGVVALVLYILSIGGNDAVRMREQQAAHKKESQSASQGGDNSTGGSVPQECNLATYKLFYASEPAASDQS